MGTPSKNSSVPIEVSTLSGVVRFSGIGVVFFMTGCWVIIVGLLILGSFAEQPLSPTLALRPAKHTTRTG